MHGDGVALRSDGCLVQGWPPFRVVYNNMDVVIDDRIDVRV